MRIIRAMVVAASLVAVAVAAPAMASAAQRFATPTGSGTTCSQASPCSLVTAVNSASSGDEVIVAGDQGSYGTLASPVTTQLQEANGVNMHGAASEPMPVIYSNVPADIAVLWNNGGTLSDLHVENLASNGVAVLIGNSGDHLLARGGGEGCEPGAGSTLIDSVCAGGGFGIGLSVGTSGSLTSTLKNVTAIGATSYGLSFDANGFSWTIIATNVIARGGFKDIATSQSSAGTVTLTLDHSNYAVTSAGAGTTITPAGSGTNQTAAPLLVNSAAGDFHQAPTSPTIDQGADSAFNGLTDFEGKPRIFGAHTDIGADEYAPPSVLSESASSITQQSAVLAGSFNSEGGPATAYFEYGTNAYSSIAPLAAPALSASPQSLSAAVSGLGFGTTYHFRLVVSNGSGTVAGPNQTFTTPPLAAHKKKCKRKHRHKRAAVAKKHKCKKKRKRR